MIRLFDFLFSLFGIIILLPLLFLIFIISLIYDIAPIFLQKRVGRNQKIFTLVKFRTMPKNTKFLATHLIDHSKITPYGYFLRRTKFDELPQLFNVLVGEMSLVGPRPCLLNQKKLIRERNKRGVFKVKPGLTGLSQISGISMKTPTLLAKLDSKMVKNLNLYFYFFYIFKTLFLIIRKKI